MPAPRDVVVNVAFPDESTASCPRTVVPSVKTTIPVGAPRPLTVGLTVALNVTVTPKAIGLGDEVSVVVVADA